MRTYRAHVVGNVAVAELQAKDVVLEAGHMAVPHDNPTSFKVGDGVTPYTQLPAYGANADSGLSDSPSPF